MSLLSHQNLLVQLFILLNVLDHKMFCLSFMYVLHLFLLVRILRRTILEDFQIASQGIPLGTAGASVALGELWVSYQIVLMKPKIPLLGSSSYVDSGYSHYSTNILAAGTCTSAAPLGGTGLFSFFWK